MEYIIWHNFFIFSHLDYDSCAAGNKDEHTCCDLECDQSSLQMIHNVANLAVMMLAFVELSTLLKIAKDFIVSHDCDCSWSETPKRKSNETRRLSRKYLQKRGGRVPAKVCRHV